MFSIWGKPWWFPHVTAIGMTLILIVIAFIIYCIWDKHNKKAIRLRKQRKRARKTYQDYYTTKE